MTDIPAYNEKEISIKDISFCYKSDRRAQNRRPGDVCSAPTVSRLPGDPEILMQMYKLY